MVYDQFLTEIAIDFNSLYEDFELQLTKEKVVQSFDQYFEETISNQDIMEEIYREAQHFGMSQEKFINDLYKHVKNFDGQIEKRIERLSVGINQGKYKPNQIFYAKMKKNILEQSLA
ncbi:hypothetical protein [Bacillus solitudinis]|uniref:hypothetical protein n=1 Tax=Bacillus solitudinis TaxID=2014074 RepID=UPI000C234659|nr:hypothetical protein [Bacillus solitudinis]